MARRSIALRGAMKFFVTRLPAALFLGACLYLASGIAAYCQPWPARPVTVVFSFPPGGSGDLVARRFAEFASKQLGHPVIVENRAGGGGIVAAVAVSKAAPDGYTLMINANGPMVLRPILDAAVGYDPVKSFTPVGLIGGSPVVIMGGAKFEARSPAEMFEWARKNPGLMTVGHPGLGTVGHLAALLLASKSGTTANYIAYRDYNQIIPDLLGGQIDVGAAAYTPQYKATRILAVVTPEPVDFLPGVPSMREAGFPGVDASTWWALYGPPNLPTDIVAKLNAVLNDYLRSPETRSQMATIGFRLLGGPPEAVVKKIGEERAVWSKVIESANIKLSESK
jgi:tripartite-type tricarboxylate transporter receptor subunit TctC